MTTLTARDLLAEAQRLLEESQPGTVSVWSRASAVLARQALEDALEGYWWSAAPGVERLNMRAQLNCLSAYGDARLASECSYAWYALSRVTHHRPYELDPTREELDSLITAAGSLVDALETR